MRPRRRVFASALVTVTSTVVLSCGRPEHRYEAVCQLIRRETVEADAQGNPTQVDIELEWDACPGDQFQVVRGGAAFARCMARYHVGEALPVRVLQWWDSRGFYTWDVYRVGECAHPIEPGTEGSFEKSQECNDTRAYGLSNGFRCSRRPFAQLVNVCPWMARE